MFTSSKSMKKTCESKQGGHRVNNISVNRGNVLELLHLITKYDAVLREHLVRSKMGSKISIAYMSPEIQQFWEIKFPNIPDK